MEDATVYNPLERLAYTIIKRRKKVQLVGLSGCGKTTMLTALKKRRDVSNEEILTNNGGKNLFPLKYITKSGDVFYIKSWDSAGRSGVYDDDKFKKNLQQNDYFMYFINVDFYLRLIKKEQLSQNDIDKFPHPNESFDNILGWLRGLTNSVQNKKICIVFTHVDEYLLFHGLVVNKKNVEQIRNEICNKYLDGYQDIQTYAIDARKYNQIRDIIDDFITNTNKQ